MTAGGPGVGMGGAPGNEYRQSVTFTTLPRISGEVEIGGAKWMAWEAADRAVKSAFHEVKESNRRADEAAQNLKKSEAELEAAEDERVTREELVKEHNRDAVKTGAERGSVEGLILAAIGQLLVEYGAPASSPDDLVYWYPYILGFIAWVSRTLEAVLRDRV